MVFKKVYKVISSEFKTETKRDIFQIFNQFDLVLNDITKIKVINIY
jgi:hypothetical protein